MLRDHPRPRQFPSVYCRRTPTKHILRQHVNFGQMLFDHQYNFYKKCGSCSLNQTGFSAQLDTTVSSFLFLFPVLGCCSWQALLNLAFLSAKLHTDINLTTATFYVLLFCGKLVSRCVICL